jgi:hypothetical protein
LRGSGAVFNHRLDCTGGVLAEESTERVRGFFETRRGTKSEGMVEDGEVPKWS